MPETLQPTAVDRAWSSSQQINLPTDSANISSVPPVHITIMLHELSAAQDLDSIRSVVKREVTQQLLPTPIGVRVALIVALRVVELMCESIDRLLAQGGAQNTGAFHDTLIYRPCRTVINQGQARNDGHGLHELTPMIDIVANHLQRLSAFSDYANTIVGLVQLSPFSDESDDLVIHRCLLASYVLGETYVKILYGELPTAKYSRGVPTSRYTKGDVKEALVRTASGPILAHHQILVLAFGSCVVPEMEPRIASLTYRDNHCFLKDWATPNRSDADSLTKVVNFKVRDSDADDDPSASPEWCLGQDYIWRARNDIADLAVRYLPRFDHLSHDGSPLPTHTGVLCTMNSWLRKVIVTSVSYGSFGFYGCPKQLSTSNYAEILCAHIGEMVRGWAIDHDSEASIGEHGLLNWVCRDCSTAGTSSSLSPANALAVRPDFAMRPSWGPHMYFYFGKRHQGFARRVDNLYEKIAHLSHYISVRPITPSCSPIAAGDSVPVIVAKLLALCGIELVDDCADNFGEAEWDCSPRICSMCEFDNSRTQLFMVSVGVTRLAVMLPDQYRSLFVHVLDTYGFRLFPAIQVRLVVQCHCQTRWIADVMSYGYAEAGTRCGQSDCSVTANRPSHPEIPADKEEAEYDNTLLTEILLRQARVEAADFAKKTGQTEWLKMVEELPKVRD